MARGFACERANVSMSEPSSTSHSSDLWNEDLAPTPPEKRTWNVWHVTALWVAMSVCIPTYMLAADMIRAHMSVGQAVGTVLLGNLIVLVPMVLNAHAGTAYGIPFPVFARASFGIRGANIPALACALVKPSSLGQPTRRPTPPRACPRPPASPGPGETVRWRG